MAHVKPEAQRQEPLPGPPRRLHRLVQFRVVVGNDQVAAQEEAAR